MWGKDLILRNEYVQYIDITQVINEYPKLAINNIRNKVLDYIK